MNTLILYCKNHIKERVIGENDTVYIGFNEQYDADIFFKKNYNCHAMLYYKNNALKIKIIGDVWSNEHKLSGTQDAEYIVYSLNNNMAFEIIRTNDTNRLSDIIDISNEKSIEIGRNNEECKIILTDNEVSDEHSNIINDKDIFYIEDNNSDNGTYLNTVGLRTNDIAIYYKLTAKTQLNNGDKIIIGKAIITYNDKKLYFNYEEGYVYDKVTNNSKMKQLYDHFMNTRNASPKKFIKIKEPPLEKNKPLLKKNKLLNILVLMLLVVLISASIYFLPQIIDTKYSSAISFFLGIIIPKLIDKTYARTKKIRNNNKVVSEISKYEEHLAEVEDEMKAASKVYRDELIKINPSISKCLKIVEQSPNSKLWDRNLSNKEFLYLRVGTGLVNPRTELKTPDLNKKAYNVKLKENIIYLRDAPITVDFRKSKILNIYGKKDICMTLTKNLIVQAATHYSPSKLKIAAIFSENGFGLDWVDELPHALTIEDKKILKDGDVESIINFFNKSSSTEEDEMSYLLFIIACTDSSHRSSIEINYAKIMEEANKVYLIIVKENTENNFVSNEYSQKIVAMSNQNIKYICNKNTISISEIDKPDNDLYNNFTNAMKKINNTIDNPST